MKIINDCVAKVNVCTLIVIIIHVFDIIQHGLYIIQDLVL